MGVCNKEVNDLLNYSKKMIDQINLCKEIPSPDELRKLQYLTFAGMYYFYGAKYLNEIIQAFLETEFIYCSESISDALRKYTKNTSKEIERLAESNAQAFFYFDFDSDGIMRRKIFVFENSFCSYGDILESIVHEVNHVVNSVNNVMKEQDDYVSIRTGLSTCIYYSDGNVIEDKRALEEVYNQLQTNDIIECIFAFSKYDIEDLDIRVSFELLKSARQSGFQCRGYLPLTPVLKPLYDCDRFSLVASESRLEGTLNKIEVAFDNEAGVGAYNLLGQYFDELHRNEDVFNYLLTSNCANVLIKQYTK